MPTVTFQQGGSYQGTVDTSIWQARPNDSSTDSPTLFVDTGSGVGVQTLLAFNDIFGSALGQIPVGATIVSATLTLTTTNGSGGGGSLHRMLIGWTELSTWSSLGNGVQRDGIEATFGADLNTGSVGIGSRTFDVTASLQAWLTGATTAEEANAANLGWLFVANSTDGWDFGSSESGTAPLLTVTFTTGEPAATQMALAGPVTAAEGTGSGTTPFTFTVTRSGDTSGTSSVSYAVAGSGTNPASANDFAGNSLPSGTLTFDPGETSKTITLDVNPDSTSESDETFVLTLSGASGGEITGGTATGTITNDDIASGSPVTTTFQQGGSYQGTIDTRLVQAQPTSTAYAQHASIGVDSGSGTNIQTLLAFTNIFGTGPGQIPVGSTIVSASLTLTTTNGSSGGGSLHRMLTGWTELSTWNSLGNGVQLDGIEATFGADLTTGSVGTGSRAFDVTASLQAWLSGAITADQANAANLGWVFVAANTDGWNFGSSESGTVPVLRVTYTPPGGTPPTAQMALAGPVTAAEGTGLGTTAFTFTVTRSGDTSGTSSASYAVTGTGTNPASASDFAGNSLPTGTVTFDPGQTSVTITVNVNRDSTSEPNETFLLTLSGATGGQITGATATGTITNDDGATAILEVRTYATSAFGAGQGSNSPNRHGSVDPTDIVYDFRAGVFYVCDSEVDESPFFATNNLFRLDSQAVIEQGINLTGFTSEPTGLAIGIDPVSGATRLFITDDNARRIYVVDPANPGVVIKSFSTTAFNCNDPEDLSYDPTTGHLFVLSEKDRSIKEITQDGALVRSIGLPTKISKPEGLAYDAENNQFFVCTGVSPDIFVVSHNGTIIETITVLRSHPNPVGGVAVVPKGLELAPSSDGSGRLSLWVTDYGQDQTADGRLIEIMLDRPAPQSSPSLSASFAAPELDQAQTFDLAEAAFGRHDAPIATNDVHRPGQDLPFWSDDAIVHTHAYAFDSLL